MSADGLDPSHSAFFVLVPINKLRIVSDFCATVTHKAVVESFAEVAMGALLSRCARFLFISLRAFDASSVILAGARLFHAVVAFRAVFIAAFGGVVGINDGSCVAI